MRVRNKHLSYKGMPAGIALMAALIGHGPLQAAPSRGAYVAALAAPLDAPRQEIVNGVLWKCAGERCSALTDNSRPLLVCQRVAKAFGQIARFATPSGELSEEDLSRCNRVG